MYRSIDDALIYRSTAVAIYHRSTDLPIYRSIDEQIYYSDQQFPLLAITTEPMINQFVELLVH